MKKIGLMLHILLALGMLGCKSQEKQTMEKAENVMEINRECDSVYRVLNNAYLLYKPEIMDSELDNFQNSLAQEKLKLSNLKLPQNCKKLREAMAKKIETLMQISENECMEMVRIFKISEIESNENHRLEWDQNRKSAENKLKEANNSVSKEYSNITNTKK